MGDKLPIEGDTRKDGTMSRDKVPQGLLSSSLQFAASRARRAAGQRHASRGESQDEPEEGFRREAQLLAGLRLVLLIALLAGVWLVAGRLRVDLPLTPLLATAAALGLSAFCLLYRVQRGARISEGRFTAQMLVDVGLLAFALYWVGGAVRNPFADLYVLYLCLAAITLPWRRLGLIFGAVVACYSFLLWNYQPLALEHAAISPGDLDDVTHWTHFVMTGSLVALFGYRLTEVARRAREAAARSREQQARNDSAVSLASLAAGTAHEMGTPLTTMAVLVSEMRRDPQIPSEWRENFDVMWKAIQVCKRSLGEMVAAVGADRIPEEEPAAVDRLIEEAAARVRALRADCEPAVSIDGAGPVPGVQSGPTLRQALVNVLNNAADASPQSVEVRVNWSSTDVYVDVLDRGPGIAPELQARLGSAVISTKSEMHGNGLGVFLASMTLARLGGRLDFLPRYGGGTCARIRLPLYPPQEKEL